MEPRTYSTQYDRLYQEINNKVIAALAQGNIIWRKPWSTNGQFPANLTTLKRYKGWNLFYLSWVMKENDFQSPYFLTFKQSQTLGGHIKKGSKGFPIVKWVKTEAKNPDYSEQADTDSGRVRYYPVTHTVFNVAQTTGIDYPKPSVQDSPHANKLLTCEELLQGMDDIPPILSGGEEACYIWPLDRIYMPEIGQFQVPEEYYSTLFHEIIHSTGHPTRLNRKELIDSSAYGSLNYSREELTAEFGAAYLCGITGIEQKTIENSAAYIQHWIGQLQSDPALILKATAKAQAAIDFLPPAEQKETSSANIVDQEISAN